MRLLLATALVLWSGVADAQVSPDQRAELARLDVARNLSRCQIYGSDSILCKPAMLSGVERAGIQQRGRVTANQPAARARVVPQPPTYPDDAALIEEDAPACAENGTCYGDISELTGRPKTVHVGGYYRKDGTYVRGHYRSKPRRH